MVKGHIWGPLVRSSMSFAVFFLLLFLPVAKAAETETQYLSGLGKDDPVSWKFECDGGQNANKWSTIGVPSNWELQGFGIYTYGRVPPPGGWRRVHGVYKRVFTTPATWKDKAVFVNFEGVMTDTRVTINGQSAGPMHQGGYYAFKYDITNLLKPAGQENQISVDVDDESANESVNHAERRGDYWNYGGIFRPVYLIAVPKVFIEHLAIKATAEGSLDVDVRLSDLRHSSASIQKSSVQMRVLALSGKPVGDWVRAKSVTLDGTNRLTGEIISPRLWTAEPPTLYQLEVRLNLDRVTIHTVHQRFGFRTMEVRPGQGLFVNGNRVFLKGFARHSFWPDSGRTLSERISKDDVSLIKEMNGNAVRSSHYPPDRHFLDACDELGLYALDELNGWQAHYDTEVGKKLVKAMVEHDVNHPSVLFWDNGNEGGFNLDLDSEYAKYDPQKRTVLHPWAPYPPGIADTKHYPTYEGLQQKLAQDPVLLPTEMLHGLYDGGGGAGLQDYWDAILKSKAGAGGFIWSFVDEDVKRVDKGGLLDSQGNFAPDGIVGPYREREASFYTIKQLWSPIIVTPADNNSGSFTVTNRYGFLNADQCTYEWQTIAFRQPSEANSDAIVVTSRLDHGRSLAPGRSGVWIGWGLHAFAPSHNRTKVADAIRLTIKDPTGNTIQTYVWPAEGLPDRINSLQQTPSTAKSIVTDSGDTLTLRAADLALQISKVTGLLVSASRQGSPFSLVNGPRVVAMEPRLNLIRGRTSQPATPAPVVAPKSKLTSLTQTSEGDKLIVSAVFDGPMKSIIYRLKSNGWLTVDYVYNLFGDHEYFGVGFDYPEAYVRGMRFLGNGPAPVYQDRLAGGTLDVWSRPYNNTVVGDPEDLNPDQHFSYPVFKGFYSGVRWLQLDTTEGPITAIVDQARDAPIYVQTFTPKSPPLTLLGQVAVPFPISGVSFLNAIPAIGNKFGGPQSMGPMGQVAKAQGEYNGHISLFFGSLPSN